MTACCKLIKHTTWLSMYRLCVRDIHTIKLCCVCVCLCFRELHNTRQRRESHDGEQLRFLRLRTKILLTKLQNWLYSDHKWWTHLNSVNKTHRTVDLPVIGAQARLPGPILTVRVTNGRSRVFLLLFTALVLLHLEAKRTREERRLMDWWDVNLHSSHAPI